MILKENLSFDAANMLIEASEEKDKEGRKKLYMTGICLQGGLRNHNGRNYPISEIRAAVEKVNRIRTDGYSLCGEADHPEDLTVSVRGISHSIEKMWMDGNCGYGKLLILPTPNGEIVRSLLESNVKLGVSSRGSGNVDGQGNVSDFDLVTIDVVHTPSGPDCYPKPVFEQVMNTKRGFIIEDLSKAVMNDPKARKYFQSEMVNFIKELKF